jgi:hypothetical protein
MKLLAALVPFLLACAGQACHTAERVAAPSSTITVEVCCDSGKQLDADYGIKITVSDGVLDTSISVPVMVQASGGACARAIESALQDKGVPASDPIVHAGQPYAPGTAWDVTLPAGYTVKSVHVQRIGAVATSDLNGQLMIHSR